MRRIARFGPDGVVVLVMLAAYMWGIKNGYDALGLYGIVCLLCTAYCTMGFLRCRHAERMQEGEVRKIEQQGKNLKLKYQEKKKPKK